MHAEVKEKWSRCVIVEMNLDDARSLHNQAYAGLTNIAFQGPEYAENRKVLSRLVDALTTAGVQLDNKVCATAASCADSPQPAPPWMR